MSDDKPGSRLIREARKRAGLSQAEAATKIGVKQPHYSGLESGTKPLNEEQLYKLCALFDLSADDVLANRHSEFRPADTPGSADPPPWGGASAPPRRPALPSLPSAEGLNRIAAALERMSPPPLDAPDFAAADAFVWHVAPDRLTPVAKVNRVDLPLLLGIDRARDTLLANTLQFARGLPANNALLWGARGMGKSSLVKAVHAEVTGQGLPLKIVEVQREDLPSIGRLLNVLRGTADRYLLFCDDMSFSHDDEHYKSLKAVLDGGVEGRPENVVFYATSNRRHLMPRDMIENERSTAISPSEATEEKVSLSDRFGLWLGFHPCSQDEYLAMIRGYCDALGIEIDDQTLRTEAIEWQATRGARSGRVAWQYVTDLAGRRGVRLP